MEASVATPTVTPVERRAATSRSGRLLVLDGLRGVAAFGVINDHVQSDALQMLIPGRALAVDFFWVLSGFVLALAYDDRLKRDMSALEFMRIRIIRFYPLYLLALIIGIARFLVVAAKGWVPMSPSEVGFAAVFGLLFLPFPPLFASTRNSLFPLNGPAYSLFYELVINFIYAVIARFLTLRVLSVILAISAILVVVIVPAHAPGAGWKWPDVDAGSVRVTYCFFAGVMVYRVRSRMTFPALPAWLAVAVYLVLIAIPATGVWRDYYDVVVILFCMPLLVACAAGSVVKGRTARIFAAMGMLSYGVYVVHVPLAGIIDLVVVIHFNLHLPGYAMVLAVATSAALLAWAADRFYDAPVRRWLSRRLVGAKARTAAGQHG